MKTASDEDDDAQDTVHRHIFLLLQKPSYPVRLQILLQTFVCVWMKEMVGFLHPNASHCMYDGLFTYSLTSSVGMLFKVTYCTSDISHSVRCKSKIREANDLVFL